MPQTLGIREFRDNFTRIAREGGEPVIVRKHDRVVGIYTPVQRDKATRDAAYALLDAIQEKWRAERFDADAALASLGKNPDGIPLDEC